MSVSFTFGGSIAWARTRLARPTRVTSCGGVQSNGSPERTIRSPEISLAVRCPKTLACGSSGVEAAPFRVSGRRPVTLELSARLQDRCRLQALLDQRDRHRPERQQPVVEGFEVRRVALREEGVAKFHDLQLPQRVTQVSRIERAAVRLLPRVARIDEALLLEQLVRLLDRHPFGVQADRSDEATVAEQCVRE